MIALRLDANLQRHLRVALEEHRRTLKRNYIPLPEGWETLVACVADSSDTTDAISTLPTRTAPVLLTRQDVAEALNVSVRTVQRLIADGRLATIKVGGSARVRCSDLDAYVASLSARTVAS